MATNFPTSVDNFTNPTANDSLNLPSHSTQHANANDAIEAVESYLLTEPFGMRLVKKQTIGTGVSTVLVSNAFSATYENYKIIVTGGVTNNITNMSMFLGTSAGGGAYYSTRIINRPDSGTPTGNGILNANDWAYFGQGGPTYINCNAEVFLPFATKITRYSANYMLNISSGSDEYGTQHGKLLNETSYTGFGLSVGGNTMTGGTIYVYGYTI